MVESSSLKGALLSPLKMLLNACINMGIKIFRKLCKKYWLSSVFWSILYFCKKKNLYYLLCKNGLFMLWCSLSTILPSLHRICPRNRPQKVRANMGTKIERPWNYGLYRGLFLSSFCVLLRNYAFCRSILLMGKWSTPWSRRNFGSKFEDWGWMVLISSCLWYMKAHHTVAIYLSPVAFLSIFFLMWGVYQRIWMLHCTIVRVFQRVFQYGMESTCST